MDVVVVSVIIVAGIVVIMATAHASATSKAECRRGRLHRWRQLRMGCRHTTMRSRMGYDIRGNGVKRNVSSAQVALALDYQQSTAKYVQTIFFFS